MPERAARKHAMKHVRSTRSRHIPRVGRAFVIALFTLALSTPAHAINCPHWFRLSDSEKFATIQDMVDSAIAGNRGRSYEVNRASIGRCMSSSARQIQYDFDDLCSDGRTASASALNQRFKDYIWDCAN